jgi:hypothetical protein
MKLGCQFDFVRLVLCRYIFFLDILVEYKYNIFCILTYFSRINILYLGNTYLRILNFNPIHDLEHM